MPTHLLLTQIWGEEGPPPPTHSINFEMTDTKDESESGFRAVSSCPIDIEKDVFVFKEDDHLQSAHSIAVVPLKVRHYCIYFLLILNKFTATHISHHTHPFTYFQSMEDLMNLLQFFRRFCAA